MAYFHYNTFDLARTSRQVAVPESNIAKLMYYLDVVCSLIEYDERNLDRLRDYSKYNKLTDSEIRVLYLACATLDPDSLNGKVMFEDEDGDLCGNSMNRIYDISQVQHNLLVVDSMFIAGRNRRVKKVMAYQPQWLEKYYNQPMLAVTVALERERRMEAISNLVETCTIS